MSETVDHFTARGAERLGEAIKGYWISRGHDVAVRIVELPRCEKRNGRAWTIATDLHGGLPAGVARPALTPLDIVRQLAARDRSLVEIERTLLNRFPNLSRGELRAAFQEAGSKWPLTWRASPSCAPSSS
jgi:hypothetical protein